MTHHTNSVDFCPYHGTNTIPIFIPDEIVCAFQLHLPGYSERNEKYPVRKGAVSFFHFFLSQRNVPPRPKKYGSEQSIEVIYFETGPGNHAVCRIGDYFFCEFQRREILKIGQVQFVGFAMRQESGI